MRWVYLLQGRCSCLLSGRATGVWALSLLSLHTGFAAECHNWALWGLPAEAALCFALFAHGLAELSLRLCLNVTTGLCGACLQRQHCALLCLHMDLLSLLEASLECHNWALWGLPAEAALCFALFAHGLAEFCLRLRLNVTIGLCGACLRRQHCALP